MKSAGGCLCIVEDVSLAGSRVDVFRASSNDRCGGRLSRSQVSLQPDQILAGTWKIPLRTALSNISHL